MAYVLDTSAVLTVLLQGPGFDIVTNVLEEENEPVFLAFVTLMETEYVLLRRLPPDEARTAIRLVEAWPVEIVESSPEWRRRAAEIKARGDLSLADAWIAALAVMRGATLIHRDPEFDTVPDLRARKLPS